MEPEASNSEVGWHLERTNKPYEEYTISQKTYAGELADATDEDSVSTRWPSSSFS